MMKFLALFLLFAFTLSPLGHTSQDFEPLYQEGIEALKSGRIEDGIEALKAASDMRPDLPELHVLLGRAYLQLGTFSRAEASFLDAIKAAPQSADAYSELAVAYMTHAKDSEKALPYFLKAIELNERAIAALIGAGWIYLLDQEKPREAEKMFERALELEPDFARGYYGLALSYVAQGKTAEALRPLTKLRASGETEYADKVESLIRGTSQSKQAAMAQPDN